MDMKWYWQERIKMILFIGTSNIKVITEKHKPKEKKKKLFQFCALGWRYR